MTNTGRLHTLLGLAAALSLAAIGPAHAYQFGDLLRGAAAGLAKMPAKPAPAPAPPPAQAGNAPGAMGLHSGTALPPLHKLGTDAVAVVEQASPGAPVRAMDYVFARQSIALGPKGALTISYLSGCLTETITGGTVTIEPEGSRVAGGRLAARPTPGCKTAKPIILARASEAGATVNRITPFSGVNWEERELKGGPPVFKWDARAFSGVTALRVKDMDKAGEPVIWQTQAAGDWAAYPPTAQRLTPGAPFKVEALVGDRVVASALFSIDPALDVAESLANRVVPLSAP